MDRASLKMLYGIKKVNQDTLIKALEDGKKEYQTLEQEVLAF